MKPICGDLRYVSGSRILSEAGLQKGDVDAIIGCPPCQGFSSLGRTKHVEGSRDRRNSLVQVFVDRIKEIRPRVVIFENVPGMMKGPHRRYYSLLIRQLTDLRYNCSSEMIQASDFGVPQRRKRVIVIAVEEGLATDAPLPIPTGYKSGPRFVKDAIKDLPPLQSGETHPNVPLHAASEHSDKVLEFIRRIPKNGGSWTDIPRRFWLPCHKRLNGDGAESVYGRMCWDEHSPTITTHCNVPSSGRFVHPEQDRGITLREAARLQTIPDDFSLRGKASDLAVWIGNGMPTRMAESIGVRVADLFN